jgi:hypothetical protein
VVRYADPGGATVGACTDPQAGGANPPCELEYAVEMVAGTGDEIVVRAGDHNVADPVYAGNKQLNIHGDAGPRPRIVMSGTGNGALIVGGPTGSGTVVRYLEIRSSTSAVSAGGVPGTATLENLLLHVTGTPSTIATGVFINAGGAGGEWILRDMVVQNDDPFGTAVALFQGNAQLRNVTAVATDADGTGLYATDAQTAGLCGSAAASTMTVKNTIARGGTRDVRAEDKCVDSNPAVVEIAHSNYRGGKVQENPPDGRVADGGGNQTNVDPLFVAAAAFDYHQLPGSPTIDAGVVDPLLGRTDIDPQHRWMGANPDIGADEFEPRICCAPRDSRAPRASRLSLRPKVFRPPNRGGSVARTRARSTRVRYTLDERATMTFTVERRTSGRRVGRRWPRCVPPTRRNRNRRRCTRYVRVRGSFQHLGQLGSNSFRFTGRLQGRKLKPGRYRLVGVPRDSTGNLGNRVRAAFRIARR